MSRKRRVQMTPEQRADAERQAQERKAQLVRLSAQPDVRIATDRAGNIVAAQRMDVFAMLLQKGSLDATQESAVRDLERDLHLAARAAGSAEVREYVSGSGCSELVTQTMIDADDRVQAIMARLHPWEGVLLKQLLSPYLQGSVLTRWRDVVQDVTGATNHAKQAERVVIAVEALVEAYGMRGAPERPRLRLWSAQ